MPLALIGTSPALNARSAPHNNLYTQIGLILLIALGSKNAILIVEYARQKREEGKQILEAAVEAARLRFRPILMTSFAFILGVLPARPCDRRGRRRRAGRSASRSSAA